MSVFGGPKITNDGLVFGYDTGYGVTGITNTTRYTLGEPTTNLADTTSKRNITVHAGTGSISNAPEYGEGWEKVIITGTTSNHRILKFPYIFQPSGSIRTYSTEIDWNGLRDIGYYFKLDGYGGNGTSIYDDNRVYNTLNTGENEGSVSIFICNNTTSRTGLNDIIYYRNYQVEEKNHASPFTPTTRSVSGSLLDLTGNNTIDLSNVSFDSNSQMYFDGTGSYIDLGPTSDLIDINANGITIEFVAKFDTITDFGAIISDYQGPAGTGFAIKLNNSKLEYRLYSISSTVSSPNDMVIGDYVYGAMTWDTTRLKLYVNDNNFADVANSNTWNNSGDLWIGRNHNGMGIPDEFNGEIPILKIYNRGLSHNEILQNYNAYKKRFNL